MLPLWYWPSTWILNQLLLQAFWNYCLISARLLKDLKNMFAWWPWGMCIDIDSNWPLVYTGWQIFCKYFANRLPIHCPPCDIFVTSGNDLAFICVHLFSLHQASCTFASSIKVKYKRTGQNARVYKHKWTSYNVHQRKYEEEKNIRHQFKIQVRMHMNSEFTSPIVDV